MPPRMFWREDRPRRRLGHARWDLADEQRDVDRRRAGGGAGRVVAEVAAVGRDPAPRARRTAARCRRSSPPAPRRPAGRPTMPGVCGLGAMDLSVVLAAHALTAPIFDQTVKSAACAQTRSPPLCPFLGRSVRLRLGASRSVVASRGAARLNSGRHARRQPPPRLQRARGRAEVAVSHRGGRIRLDRLVQEGCGKALLPRTHGADARGRARQHLGRRHRRRPPRLAPRGRRRRRARRDHAGGRARLPLVRRRRAASRRGSALGAGAALDWLPQETILFEGAPARPQARGRDGRATRASSRSRPSCSAAPPWASASRPARSPTSGASAAAGASSMPRRSMPRATSPRHRRPRDARAAAAPSRPSSSPRPAPPTGSTPPARSSTAPTASRPRRRAKPDLLIVRFVAAEARPLRAALDPLSDGLPVSAPPPRLEHLI